MIINCLLPGVLEMGVVLVGVVYVPTFHFKKLATMSLACAKTNHKSDQSGRLVAYKSTYSTSPE